MTPLDCLLILGLSSATGALVIIVPLWRERTRQALVWRSIAGEAQSACDAWRREHAEATARNVAWASRCALLEMALGMSAVPPEAKVLLNKRDAN